MSSIKRWSFSFVSAMVFLFVVLIVSSLMVPKSHAESMDDCLYGTAQVQCARDYLNVIANDGKGSPTKAMRATLFGAFVTGVLSGDQNAIINAGTANIDAFTFSSITKCTVKVTPFPFSQAPEITARWIVSHPNNIANDMAITVQSAICDFVR